MAVSVIEGKVWKFGDNINTDYIMPNFARGTTREEIASFCMRAIRPEFAHEVRPGDVIVGGNNFGCGSSREHAPWALEMNGINLVIAESFARIFRQNMFNCGMMAVELPPETIDLLFQRFGGRETVVETDYDNNTMVIRAGEDEERIPFTVSDFDHKLVKAGGWVDYADQHY